MGARLGSDMSKRLFNLIVTNVPGPQFPLYAGDAHLLATYPVLVVAAAEVVVGLGLIVAILRRRPGADADDLSLMKG